MNPSRKVLNKLLYGETLPPPPPPTEVSPLILLYTLFDRKGPFIYLLLTNGPPVTYLV